MGVISDLKQELQNYPTSNCKTEIVGYVFTGQGARLDVEETFKYRVRVTNEGELDMKNVMVQTLGTRYADVSQSSGSYGSSANAGGTRSLDAGESFTTGYFRGKAKVETDGEEKVIVKARITRWDADLSHLLKDHTWSGVSEGVLKKVIDPG